ncbi:MAG: hypothetical protein BWY49_00250 [Candidatus Omnitrophica bacterium ADurb.Bin314]|nr:MAG: hypothetical protein BWY49_00250 [Candidatus Omnitrophica bacterium ADurb.Bin314]
MPGAMAIGAFAKRPVKRVASAVARQVTVISAVLSMPAAARIEGFTKMI